MKRNGKCFVGKSTVGHFYVDEFGVLDNPYPQPLLPLYFQDWYIRTTWNERVAIP